MKVIIVESPTKERTIAKFLSKSNDKYIVKSSYGHVRDLPKNLLGVDEKNNFKPYYIILPKAKKVISELKKIVQQSEKTYLATDYDREGEAIAWHLTKVLGLSLNDVLRITFHEITPQAIYEALSHPRKIDINLVNSQQARRIIDRLVGYKISPLLWKKITNGLSAGRVQSVALKFIYDREKEIQNFAPQEYWSIECEFYKEENQQQVLNTKLVSIEGKKIEKLDIKSKDEAEKIVNEIKKIGFGKIVDIKIEEKFKSPPEPYITSTLQQEASSKLKFSPSKTMSVAQSLYEGVDLGNNERVGLITYMRTDSVYVSDYAIEELRKYIKEKFTEEYLSEHIRKYKTKIKNAQEAHEAIRPTSVYREPEKIKQYLTEDQYKLYKLIWTKFVATQIKDMKYRNIVIDLDVDKRYLFEFETKKVLFDGYTKILPEEYKKENGQYTEITNINKNDILKVKDCIQKQHFTEPPPRYTEASLIKELEKNGIGRPSTYATIVDTLKQRGYVKLKERKFYITELGKEVIELLSKHFTEIVAKSYTAKIEKLLDKIAQGKEEWVKVVNIFYEPLIKEIEKASKEIEPKKNEVFTEKKCELCGGSLIIRRSRYGKFLSCENFPKCRYKTNYDEKNFSTKKSS
jgi:DNA topoisomerase-1